MPDTKSSSEEKNLIRLHPNEGGLVVTMGKQRFVGVGPDVFIGLDLRSPGSVYRVTRKFNINIDVDPGLLSAKSLFRKITRGPSEENPFKSRALQETEKCKIHGDAETRLCIHPNLEKLLDQSDLNKMGTGVSFVANGRRYQLDSIGVAANPGYAPVPPRRSSHFEIKFREVPTSSSSPIELLCLNIHLHPRHLSGLDIRWVMARLNDGIRLFYSELNVLQTKFKPTTRLLEALTVDLDNFDRKRFSCPPWSTDSFEALEKYREAKRYTSSVPSTTLILGHFMPKGVPAFARGTSAAAAAASAPSSAPGTSAAAAAAFAPRSAPGPRAVAATAASIWQDPNAFPPLPSMKPGRR